MTLITPETTTHTPAILIAIDPWQPLSPETIEIVRAELDAFQTDPTIMPWNLTYKALFSAIESRLTILAQQLDMPRPAFSLHFAGIFKNQAGAQILPDGKKIMLIGADFIRTYLLCQDQAQAEKAHDTFMWILAHELGHLVDPLFQQYNKYSASLQFLAATGQCLLWMGFIGWLFPLLNAMSTPGNILLIAICFSLSKCYTRLSISRPTLARHSTLQHLPMVCCAVIWIGFIGLISQSPHCISSSGNVWLMIAGFCLYQLSKGTVLALRRFYFEYTADATAVRITKKFDAKNMATAMQNIRHAIEQDITTAFHAKLIPTSSLSGISKLIAIAKNFVINLKIQPALKKARALYPPIEKRLDRMIKLSQKKNSLLT